MAASSDFSCQAFRQAIEGECAAPDNEDVPPLQRFFLRSELINICTLQKIIEVLECQCRSCLEQASTELPFSTSQYANWILGREQSKRSSIILFSLLSYIGGARLICGFLNLDQIDDEFLISRLEDFNENHIQLHIWPSYSQKYPRKSSTIANEFRWRKYQFFVPLFQDESFSKFSPFRILPFTNEKPIMKCNEEGVYVQDHGAYGRVYSFTIPSEYNSLPVSLYCERYSCPSVRC